MSLLSRLAVTAARAYGALSSKSTNVSASYLVVAGGAGGGAYIGGGGGAGGYLTSTATLSTLNTYSITVGAGGTAGINTSTAPGSGNNSVLSGTGLTTVTSTGGGGGGYSNTSVWFAGSNGGSGGGGGIGSMAGGTGTSGQGNAGGAGSANVGNPSAAGGGGGAGAVGGTGVSSTAGNGGNGTASSISGSSVTYAGGGGGSVHVTYTGTSTGGSGGGGAGGSSSAAGTAGTTNLGGGGGGAGVGYNGGAGGSGIVIISYTSATPKFVGGTLTTSGGNQIHTFTSSGTLSPLTPVTASYLVIAGGGSGGADEGGGGGGAGGYRESTATIYSGGTYVVTVGAGGASVSTSQGYGNPGSNSSLAGTGLTTISASGGGYGGAYVPRNGGTGGSGGGGGNNGGTGAAGNAGSYSPVEGYAGGNCGSGTTLGNRSGGAGGGAGGVGTAGPSGAGTAAGGIGVASSISGTSVTRGVGGNNGYSNSGIGASGTPNTGNGGAGGGQSNVSGSGGSGTVIISYAGSQVFNGGLVTTSGGNTIHTFNATGALTPVTNNLNNSLRFRRSASAYLSRTPASATNRKTWTWSGWVKRGFLSNSYGRLFAAADASGNNEAIIGFSIGGLLEVYSYISGYQLQLNTTQVFRDTSAWYHIVVAFDTTQATSANRCKVYVNGIQVTSFSPATYPSQNYDGYINVNDLHNIGYDRATSESFDGYMTDINFIDGQALEPYYFGNNDAYGNWKPIKYTGMYGTNGFYLTFSDTSAATAAAIGKDSSGNGNNWTPNNISVTAGVTYDAMLDVPTNTSATVANYCVLNPLDANPAITVAQGNLSYTSSNDRIVKATMSVTSGKWYWEFTAGNGGNPSGCGAINPSVNIYAAVNLNVATSGVSYLGNGNKSVNGTATAYGSTFTTSDIIGVALDLTSATNTITFYKNNTSQGAITLTSSLEWCPAFDQNAGTNYVNFGQRPFTYTAPSGFVALNTYNLPTPTILQGNKYMDATLYTGTGAALNVVNQGQFKPDFVWGKDRAQAQSHLLFDSVRGVHNFLSSNSTSAESTNSTTLTSFNSNGFGLGTNATLNQSGISFVGWQWQAGQGTTSSNTSGSITSTVSVNTTAGFSVVTYTGTGANATVGHGLGVAPKMIIVKGRSNAYSWPVWHNTFNVSEYLYLNGTFAKLTFSNIWNQLPTSTTIGISSDVVMNQSAVTYVAYCWAEIAGFSAFGSYTGNGSTDGPFVFTGFRPKFVMIKRTDAVESWEIFDTSRSSYNTAVELLEANSSSAESTSAGNAIDILSNGFKQRNTRAATNASGGTYIVMAFAENPFKNSNAR